MTSINSCLKCIKKYLDKEIDIDAFSYEFPSILFAINEEASDDVLDALGDISEACCNYEADEEIRQEDEIYLSEKQVNEIVNARYKLIKELV